MLGRIVWEGVVHSSNWYRIVNNHELTRIQEGKTDPGASYLPYLGRRTRFSNGSHFPLISREGTMEKAFQHLVIKEGEYLIVPGGGLIAIEKAHAINAGEEGTGIRPIPPEHETNDTWNTQLGATFPQDTWGVLNNRGVLFSHIQIVAVFPSDIKPYEGYVDEEKIRTGQASAYDLLASTG